MPSVVLDSNFNDIAVKWGVDNSYFEGLGYDVLSTRISENEISNCSKKEVLEKYIELNTNAPKIGFFGFDDNPDSLGFSDLFDDKPKEWPVLYSLEYDVIIGENQKYRRDNLLIVLAKIFDAVFISGDIRAIKHAISHGVNSIFIKQSESTKIPVEVNNNFAESKITLMNVLASFLVPTLCVVTPTARTDNKTFPRRSMGTINRS